jgi:hypothetical protein
MLLCPSAVEYIDMRFTNHYGFTEFSLTMYVLHFAARDKNDFQSSGYDLHNLFYDHHIHVDDYSAGEAADKQTVVTEIHSASAIYSVRVV